MDTDFYKFSWRLCIFLGSFVGMVRGLVGLLGLTKFLSDRGFLTYGRFGFLWSVVGLSWGEDIRGGGVGILGYLG